MVKLDARQGAPKDGNSPFELFQVSGSLWLFFSQQSSVEL